MHLLIKRAELNAKLPHSGSHKTEKDSWDELDTVPKNINIGRFEIVWCFLSLIFQFIDIVIDINVAVRYYLNDMHVEFGWTLVFILVPGMITSAISQRMYNIDVTEKTESDEVKRWKWLRVLMLVLLMAPALRLIYYIVYAIKSRSAAQRKDPVTQRMYFLLMLKEDSDAALLRIFDCFLEAAPQMVLQTALLIRQHPELTGHQSLSIASSIISLGGMGFVLASFQRAIRYLQSDKRNVNWLGIVMQTLWHFFVSLSRVSALSILAYLFPYSLLAGSAVHILLMTLFVFFRDRPPICDHLFATLAFSAALGAVYLFTYIPAKEIQRTRCRYISYYTICVLENIACAVIWYFYCDKYVLNMRDTYYYVGFLVISTVPFVVGLFFMFLYYLYFHPRSMSGVNDVLEM